MSFNDHLIHTCDIQRPVPGGEDKYGGDETTPNPVAAGVRCRLVEKDRRLQSDEHAAGVLVVEHKMLFPPATDVQEGDTISQIKLEDGSLLGHSFTVQSVLARRGKVVRHKTAVLERVG